MRTPAPLPPDVPSAFAVADAQRWGLSARRLRASDLETPYRGVRLHGRVPSGSDGIAQEAWRYAPRLKEWQFYSHETALALHDVPTPPFPHRTRLHVSAHRPRREPRIQGVVGHRLQTRAPAWSVDERGLPLEDPVRAWRQAGTLWRLDDLIVAADALVTPQRRLASVTELQAEIEEMGDVRGGLLMRALREVRAGSESPGETRTRLLLVRAGLPEPELNIEIFDDRGLFIARLDMAYPRYRVAVELDGRQHAEDARQFARDADRWAAIRAADWDLVRILQHHTRGPRPEAPALVAAALRRAGWRG
ncbi:hypothetical protein [Microbacterium album]|nr:hypothetical protein [Microbacterium album]